MAQILVVRQPADTVTIGPGEIRDVTIDWAADLPAGVTITATTFTPSAGLAVSLQTVAPTGTATGVRLSGATKGRRYEVFNNVELSDGETYRWPFDVRCK